MGQMCVFSLAQVYTPLSSYDYWRSCLGSQLASNTVCLCGLYQTRQSPPALQSCTRRVQTVSSAIGWSLLQVFKTGVDEWLRLCQLFKVLVLKYCDNVDIDVDENQLPPLVPPDSPANGKAAKGKAAAAKGKAATAKGVAQAAAAITDSQKGKCASKGLPAVESIKGLRLGDCAERGKSGRMPYVCQLYADLVWCCLPCTEAHIVINLVEVCIQFFFMNVWKKQRQQLSIGSFSKRTLKTLQTHCSTQQSQLAEPLYPDLKMMHAS